MFVSGAIGGGLEPSPIEGIGLSRTSGPVPRAFFATFRRASSTPPTPAKTERTTSSHERPCHRSTTTAKTARMTASSSRTPDRSVPRRGRHRVQGAIPHRPSFARPSSSQIHINIRPDIQRTEGPGREGPAGLPGRLYLTSPTVVAVIRAHSVGGVVRRARSPRLHAGSSGAVPAVQGFRGHSSSPGLHRSAGRPVDAVPHVPIQFMVPADSKP